MKRAYVIMLAVLSAMTASAQTKTDMLYPEKVKMPLPTVAPAAFTGKSLTAAPPHRRTVSDGVYYTKPEGTMFQALSTDRYGYNCTLLNIPAWREVTFTNQCVNKSEAAWSFVYSGNEYTPEDLGDRVTEDNDLIYYQGTGFWYPAPTITENGVDFVIGNDNYYLEYYKLDWNTYYTRIVTDSIASHSFYDYHVGSTYYGYGFLSSHYLFGSGSISDSSATYTVSYTVSGVYEEFPKPASPLYVDTVFSYGITLGTDSLPDLTPVNSDGVLTMIIVDTTLTDTMAVLTADSSDFETNGTAYDEDYDGYGKRVSFDVYFTKKGVDPLTGERITEPFVIDKAFYVIIKGFDDEDVNFGLCGYFPVGDDEFEDYNNLPMAVFLCYDSNGDPGPAYGYTDRALLPLSFISFFDAVEVGSTLGYYDDEGEFVAYDAAFNVLRVSDDGTEVTTDGAEGEENIGAAYVLTLVPWFNGDGDENYYLADTDDNVPDWLTSFGINTEYYYNVNGYTDGVNYVIPQCEALPEGVTGRWARMVVWGRGVVSDDPIWILQGDITLEQAIKEYTDDPTSIHAVTAEKGGGSRVYDLSGRSVRSASRGIFIRGGKKIAKK